MRNKRMGSGSKSRNLVMICRRLKRLLLMMGRIPVSLRLQRYTCLVWFGLVWVWMCVTFEFLLGL
ncbi:hypothetical protein HanIR_Chr01g0018631 [Helianthus annuus]|nr:hypothetical protein HanIR_Chr01g0018631 [Helianthus annuus]